MALDLQLVRHVLDSVHLLTPVYAGVFLFNVARGKNGGLPSDFEKLDVVVIRRLRHLSRDEDRG